jgi:rhodanese-related sulfurtransferase
MDVVILMAIAGGSTYGLYKRGVRLPESVNSAIQKVLGPSASGLAPARTAACNGRPKASNLRISRGVREGLNAGVITATITYAPLCLERGDINVEFGKSLDGGDSVFQDTDGVVTITDLSSFDLPSILPADILKAGYKPQDFQTLALATEARHGHIPQAWFVVHFVLKKIATVKSFRGIDRLNFAKTVTAAELDDLLAKGAVLIDVRPEAEFASHHHPKAVNIPYAVSSTNNDTFMKYSEFVAGDSFPVERLPKNSSRPLVFSGVSPGDFRPIRAILKAKHENRTELYWLRGGEAERQNISFETAPSYDGIRTVSADEALLFVTGGQGVVVDARGKEAYERMHIFNAVNIPYLERSIEMTAASHLKLSDFKTAGESFAANLTGEPEKPVLVYGIDLYDEKPVKAAAWLKESGWKEVLWLRDGLTAWEQAREAGNAAYRVLPPPQTESTAPAGK